MDNRDYVATVLLAVYCVYSTASIYLSLFGLSNSVKQCMYVYVCIPKNRLFGVVPVLSVRHGRLWNKFWERILNLEYTETYMHDSAITDKDEINKVTG